MFAAYQISNKRRYIWLEEASYGSTRNACGSPYDTKKVGCERFMCRKMYPCKPGDIRKLAYLDECAAFHKQRRIELF